MKMKLHNLCLLFSSDFLRGAKIQYDVSIIKTEVQDIKK